MSRAMETEREGRDKRSLRPPPSPLEDESTKKLCDRLDGTTGGDSGEGGGAGAGGSLTDATIAQIVEAVSIRVKSDLSKDLGALRGEIVRLRAELTKKDQVIAEMQKEVQDLHERQRVTEDRLDETEQYSRRNSVRIHGIPEDKDENTDNIVIKLCEQIGADVFVDSLDRSHRVGRKGDYSRPILCKFTSHKFKLALLTKKKRIADIDTQKHFSANKIFVNEDLTKQRSTVAREARLLKKHNKISDTWTRDGVIFVKTLSGSIDRITNMRGLPA